MVDLVDLASAGDFGGARDVHFRLYPLFKALFLETNPIPVKAAMAMQGMIGPEVRLPLVPASDTTLAALEKALAAIET
jgi:4-hydroxy-tetrahydrodipicolinate synthase